MLFVAAFISAADLKLKTRQDLQHILTGSAIFVAGAVLLSLVTFRLTQPMSFRAETGETSLFTLHLNPDWVRNMTAARTEFEWNWRRAAGRAVGPPPGHPLPACQHAAVGSGAAAGGDGWAGLLLAGWRTFRFGEGWKAHLLPLVWTGGYFLFMATRWVKSIRYFLPIYPFLCLFAAWGLLELWRRGRTTQNGVSKPARLILPAALILLVTLGTLAWAGAFVNAVYRTDHTRVQATRWIYENIPAPLHLTLYGRDGAELHLPLAAPDGLLVNAAAPYVQPFSLPTGAKLASVTIPHASSVTGGGWLRLVVASDAGGLSILDETEVILNNKPGLLPGPSVQALFHQVGLAAEQIYYLIVSSPDEQGAILSRSVIANENWDEGLPFPFDGRDPFGQLYRGATMEVRWYDAENKRQMFLETIAQADYIILPSQRGIWTTCRIPRTYPMTMNYYRALFNGQLGFDLAAQFSSPFKLGALYISDIGGTWAWDRVPQLPLFNNSLLAAEEAFSVYDHPPVWIFKKRADFDLAQVRRLLDAVDLRQVVVQSPRNADGVPCQ